MPMRKNNRNWGYVRVREYHREIGKMLNEESINMYLRMERYLKS